jgi:trans-aconitate methyltransferase
VNRCVRRVENRVRAQASDEIVIDPRQVLELPAVYQKFQEWGGFFGARLKAMRDYMPKPEPGATVYDIGCGPGHIVQNLTQPINYHGFDVDKSYIDFATRHFGQLGQFHLREFDDTAARTFGKADLIMMNALLHHLPDEHAARVLTDVRESLAAGGALFTLDGCLRDGQHPVARWMHRNDRGEHVRDEPGYRRVLERVFPSVEIHIREDLSWVPHTYCITVCRA